MSGDVSDNELLVVGLLGAHLGAVRSPEPSACIAAADHAGYLSEAHFGALGDAGGGSPR